MKKRKILLLFRKKYLKRGLYIIIAIGIIGFIFLCLLNNKKSLITWKESNSLRELLFDNYRVNGRIAIIIDDFGNNGEGTREMLTLLNRPLTCAIMPFMPYTREEAELAHELGHEIIIHIPMEPHKGNPKWLGPKGITTLLTTKEIKDIVKEAIEDVPFAVGVNNHMGSKATEDRRVIGAIMEVLKEKNMYIVDSKTSGKSVIREVAEEYGVKVFERDIFLDNKKDIYNIKRQIKKLELVAEKNSIAIGIGHVGPEGGRVTANAIREMIPEIEAMGLEIVTVSKLLEE